MPDTCTACKTKDCDKCAARPRKRCGRVTEIFSRVCGYHRPVKNWNKGKQEEFRDRKEYIPEVNRKKN